MKIEKILKISEISNKNIRTNKEEKYSLEYPVIKKYLENKIYGKDITNLLLQLGKKKIGLCGLNYLADFLYMDIKDNHEGLEVVCVSDKNYLNFCEGFQGYSVMSNDRIIEEYHRGTVDTFIICSIINCNEMIETLINKKVKNEDIISIVTLIYNCS